MTGHDSTARINPNDDEQWPVVDAAHWRHLAYPEALLVATAEAIGPETRGAVREAVDVLDSPCAAALGEHVACSRDDSLRRLGWLGRTFLVADADLALAESARAARDERVTELFTWRGLGLCFHYGTPNVVGDDGSGDDVHGLLLNLRAGEWELTVSLAPDRIHEHSYVRAIVEATILSLRLEYDRNHAAFDLADTRTARNAGTTDPSGGLIAELARPDTDEPCLYELADRCATHDCATLLGYCETAVARELLRRHRRLPLYVPHTPMTALAAHLRDAAVAMELALTGPQRHRFRSSYLADSSEDMPGVPVCVMLTMAASREALDDHLPVHRLEFRDVPKFRTEVLRRWPGFAAIHLADQPVPAAWLLTGALVAKYLGHGRPDFGDILDIVHRAVTTWQARRGGDEVGRLRIAYDRLAASIAPRAAHSPYLNAILEAR